MPFCSCCLFSCSTVKMNNYIKMSDSLSLKYLSSFPLKKCSPSLQYSKASVLHGTHSDTDSRNVSCVCDDMKQSAGKQEDETVSTEKEASEKVPPRR